MSVAWFSGKSPNPVANSSAMLKFLLGTLVPVVVLVYALSAGSGFAPTAKDSAGKWLPWEEACESPEVKNFALVQYRELFDQ